MAQITLEQKRLENIRKQLYGRGDPSTKIAHAPETYNQPSSDGAYLKKDLLKILLFTTFAISIQLFLYFSQLSQKLLGLI